MTGAVSRVSGSWTRVRRGVAAACAAVALATGAVAVAPVAIPSASAVDVVTWSGVVRTADGIPVPGVRLDMFDPYSAWSAAPIESDTNGAFSIDLPAGEVCFMARTTDRVPVELPLPQWFSLNGCSTVSATTNADLNLKRPGTRRGSRAPRVSRDQLA